MFDTFLSLLFPPSHNEQLLSKVQELLPEPMTVSYGDECSITSCARYDTPEVRAAILINKQRMHERATVLLANLLADTLLEELADEFLWNNQQVLIVPIPLAKKQQRKRGFNQMKRVLDLAPDTIRHHVVYDLLAKEKETRSQKSLSREERLLNPKGAFSVAPSYKLQNTHVIVVDDVVTTGATLLEAARVVEAVGVKRVSLVALARA